MPAEGSTPDMFVVLLIGIPTSFGLSAEVVGGIEARSMECRKWIELLKGRVLVFLPWARQTELALIQVKLDRVLVW